MKNSIAKRANHILSAAVKSMILFAVLASVLTSCGSEKGTDEKEARYEKKTVGAGAVYTSIGDSIGAGTRLPEYTGDNVLTPGCYAELIGKGIKAKKVNQLAVTGADTKDTLEFLKDTEYAAAVAESDVITVAIGSNDILHPGVELILKAVGYGKRDDFLDRLDSLKSKKLELLKILSDASNEAQSEEGRAVMDAAVKAYKENFIKIVDKIRELNQDAILIIESYYNPYAAFSREDSEIRLDLGVFVQEYIDRMNEFITNHEYNGEKYVIADISDVANEKTNVVIDITKGKFDVDPHPNTEGHIYISQKTLGLLSVAAD